MIVTQLRKLDACSEALNWVGDRKNWESAWRDCERGDWMLWLAAKLKIDRRYIVAAACACAQGVLHLIPRHEKRPVEAVRVAIEWTQGRATIEQVRSAVYAADAADVADAAVAAYAADAAANAADAADAVYAEAVDVTVAANAAAAAANAAANAAADATHRQEIRKKILSQCAERVRTVIPWAMVEKAINN